MLVFSPSRCRARTMLIQNSPKMVVRQALNVPGDTGDTPELGTTV